MSPFRPEPEAAPRGGRYARSAALLPRAERVIPLGSQTFSKSRTQYPEGAAPLFLERGRGGRVWDVDGNEYVDLVCGLLPVVLGYCDADVDAAIGAQLRNGITFSLATELEIEVAERLVEIVPCAEAVRFGKNGTDATSAAVRLARAFTGRDHIAAAGYHGWQDWYIGATARKKGVPDAVAGLTHLFPYNDLHALESLLSAHPGEFAAVIMEPMNTEQPADGYLHDVRDITHRHGALLIFDEIITGFRYALGGAQEHFGVVPDLAALGKGMANGMPLSAIVGRADVMAEMEEVFFSATFGGETLSLAAAVATIDKMRREPVIDTLWETGTALTRRVEAAIEAHGLGEAISLAGLPPWRLFVFNGVGDVDGAVIKTFLIREMLREGVLVNVSHNVCYAHTEGDVEHVAGAYDRVLPRLADELQTPGLADRLGCPAIHPVFSVR